MEGRPRKVVRYLTAYGKDPYGEWFERQGNARGRIASRVARIEENGNFGDCAAVGAGVFELRFLGPGPGYRVYFAEDFAEDQIVLLLGGTKKTQRTDVLRARGYWSDYNA